MHPADRGTSVANTAAVFLSLSTVAVALRCYCRLVLVRNFGTDDWAALAAWAFYILYGTFSISGTYHGTGQHTANIPLDELPLGIKWWWACEPAYVVANLALKFSIAIMLLRIAVSKTHRMIIYVTVGILQIYSIFFCFLFIFQCKPIDFFWTRYAGATEGSCIDTTIVINATYAYSALSCWADWTLAIVPMFIVSKLQMDVRSKVSVAMILGLGAIASTATIIRIPYINGLANVEDFLYATTGVAIWSTAETGLGLTAASLATLRPLFRTFYQRSGIGGSTPTPAAWPTNKGPSGGYIRSRGQGGIEEYGLRADLGKHIGVTTVVEGDSKRDVEKGVRRGRSEDNKRDGDMVGRQNQQWNTSESQLVDRSSGEEDAPWESGIRKTTVQIQTQSGARF